MTHPAGAGARASTSAGPARRRRSAPTLLPAGTFLGAAQIALIAAANRAAVLCRPRPRVVVVSTGSELVEAGRAARATGRSRTPTATCCWPRAGRPARWPTASAWSRTTRRSLLETLEDHLIRADLLLTTGGVSVGAYDVVKEVLSRLGTVAFDKVAMQPGMPQGFGTLGAEKVPIFTLPGNPVSALVSFEVFVRPALRRMLGAAAVLRPQVTVETSEPFRSPPGKRLLPAGASSAREPDGRVLARTAGGQGSHMLTGDGRGERAARRARGHDRGAGRHATLPALLLERRSASMSRTRPAAVGSPTSTRPAPPGWSTSPTRPSPPAPRPPRGRLLVSPEVVGLLRGAGVPKGDALGVARIAGIMGAKQVPDLIPLCHPIALAGVKVDLDGRRRRGRDHRDRPGPPTAPASRWRR